MKTHLLNRSLLALVLSSSALVAATSQPPAAFSSNPIISGGPIPIISGGPIPIISGGPIKVSGPISFQPPATLSGNPIISGGPIPIISGGPIPIISGGPIKVSGPVQIMPAVAPFTECDAGTPISIPLNGQFCVSLTTDSKVDKVGSFWLLLSYSSNMDLTLKDGTINDWFNEGSERELSNTFFTFKPSVLAPSKAEVTFALAEWLPVASDSANVTASKEELHIIRTISFPLTVGVADDNTSTQPSHSIPISSDVQ